MCDDSKMKRHVTSAVCILFFMLALVTRVYAADESFADRFLGSPLLILAGIFVIVAVAFVYHKIKK